MPEASIGPVTILKIPVKYTIMKSLTLIYLNSSIFYE
jgi:hypothetical protein